MACLRREGWGVPVNPDKLKALKKVLRKKSNDGAWRYSDEEVRYFLIHEILVSGANLTDAPKAVLVAIGDLAAKAGAKPGDPPAHIKGAMEAYFKAHPVSPELRAEMQDAIKHALEAGGINQLGTALQKALGQEQRSGVLGGDGKLPAGAVRAGPLARFTVPDAKPVKR